MRTKIMASRGLFHAIHPHYLTPESLAAAIAERIAAPGDMNEGNLPPLDGASRAAACMLTEV